MRLGLVVVWLFALLGMAPAWATDDETPLQFGVFPYLSSGTLQERHNPLRHYLEALLERPVRLVTGSSMKEFMQRTRQGQYDFVITAPHLARLAEYRDGYVPLVRSEHDIQGVFLVPQTSPVKELRDLQGKRISLVEPTAILSQLATRQLGSLGLRNGENVSLIYARTHDNAMVAPLLGDADASLAGRMLFEQSSYTTRLRIIAETNLLPGVIFLARGDVPADDVARLREYLPRFGSTESGVGYFRTTGFVGFRPIGEQEMAAMQAYIEPFLAN